MSVPSKVSPPPKTSAKPERIPLSSVSTPKGTGSGWLAIGVFACIVAFCILAGVWAFLHQKSGIQPLGSATPVTQATATPTPTPEPGMTLLLMGKGGAGHEGGALTDTMLIVRILEDQKRVVLISIPRDLWVAIDNDRAINGKGKINSAYAFGGGTLAKQVSTTVTGIPIDSYITVDFSGFEQAIDAIGGIDVSVERAFTDYEYPIAGRESMDCSVTTSGSVETSEADLIASGALNPELLPDLVKQYPCRYELLHFDKGTQHLSGKVALKFVRSRHSNEDGNDFARSRRQRLVLEAVATKLVSLGMISKVPTFFSTLKSHIDTDMSATTIAGFLPQATGIRTYPVTTLTLSTDNYLEQGYMVDRQFALTPLAGEGKYDAIHNIIASTINPAIPLVFPTIEVIGTVKNASQSAKILKELRDGGYPAKLGKLLLPKQATTSATLRIENPRIPEEVRTKLQSLLGVSDSFTQETAPIQMQLHADIQVLVP